MRELIIAVSFATALVTETSVAKEIATTNYRMILNDYANLVEAGDIDQISRLVCKQSVFSQNVSEYDSLAAAEIGNIYSLGGRKEIARELKSIADDQRYIVNGTLYEGTDFVHTVQSFILANEHGIFRGSHGHTFNNLAIEDYRSDLRTCGSEEFVAAIEKIAKPSEIDLDKVIQYTVVADFHYNRQVRVDAEEIKMLSAKVVARGGDFAALRSGSIYNLMDMGAMDRVQLRIGKVEDIKERTKAVKGSIRELLTKSITRIRQ